MMVARAIFHGRAGQGDAALPHLCHRDDAPCKAPARRDKLRAERLMPFRFADMRRESDPQGSDLSRRDRRLKCRRKPCSRSPWSLSLPLAPRKPKRPQKSPSSRPTPASSDTGAGRDRFSAPIHPSFARSLPAASCGARLWSGFMRRGWMGHAAGVPLRPERPRPTRCLAPALRTRGPSC